MLHDGPQDGDAREGRRRIAIIGAGAIGGIVAAILASRGHYVTLCVRRPLTDFKVEMDGQTRSVPLRITVDPAVQRPVDWVMLATKVQDTDSTKPWLDQLVGPGTVVAALQNGIDHVERVQPLLRQGRVLPTIVYTSAELVAPGHVRHHTGQRIVVPSGAPGASFAALFAHSPMTVDQVADFKTAAWRKLFGNIAVAPITALTLQRIGIMRDPDIRRLARGLLLEAVQAGRAAGADLREAEADETVDFYAAYNPSGGSSMLYDRLAGRPMEHEHLTGALVRAAERAGVEVPLNRALLALLRGLDRKRDQLGQTHLQGDTCLPS